jgi:hypothetical protein
MNHHGRFLIPLFALALVGAGAAWCADPAGPAASVDGYEKVGFDKLASFTFTPPAEGAPETDAAALAKGNEQIPERVRAFDTKKVAVTGFMLPVKMDGGLVKEFLLVKDPMLCCYGVMPRINEWIVVKMNGKGVPPLMDVPITFEGTLKVGAMYENGYLTGIYLLAGDKLADTKS